MGEPDFSLYRGFNFYAERDDGGYAFGRYYRHRGRLGTFYAISADCPDGDPGAALDDWMKGSLCPEACFPVCLPEDCDDGDACTEDACDGDACANTPIDPDDGDLCTIDTCDPETGPSNVPLECPPAPPCREVGCSDGVCFHTPIDCNDGDACTADTCILAENRCTNTPIPECGN